jgi:hypothetical protein
MDDDAKAYRFPTLAAKNFCRSVDRGTAQWRLGSAGPAAHTCRILSISDGASTLRCLWRWRSSIPPAPYSSIA